MADIRIGTSAFTAAGWEGRFYPRGMKPADYLAFYATKFNTVELDNTFYRTPALSTVKGWYAKTPPGFLFAAKIPQIVTHEKVLAGSEEDLAQFLKVMDGLGEKLGPMLFARNSRVVGNSSGFSNLSSNGCRRDTSSRSRFGTELGWTNGFWICCGSMALPWRSLIRAGCLVRGKWTASWTCLQPISLTCVGSGTGRLLRKRRLRGTRSSSIAKGNCPSGSSCSRKYKSDG